MENVKVNEMNGSVLMSLKAKVRKEDRFTDLTSLIVNEISFENDMAFCKLEDYKSGECFDEDDDSKILYGFNEDEIWDKLFEITNTKDWNELHMMFKNARFCDHENLMVFELTSGEKFCALRL